VFDVAEERSTGGFSKFKFANTESRGKLPLMIALPLNRMSRAEKIMALEALWEDLSRDEAEFVSPEWHREELAATARRVDSGQEQSVDWESAKERLRQKLE
jgi:hypothetical protein